MNGHSLNISSVHWTEKGSDGGSYGNSMKVTGTCCWTGYDFAVINISTGYLVALLRSSVLAQGIKIGLIGYWRVTPFITGLLPRGSHPTMFMTGPRSGHQPRCNIATGYAYDFFSKVYCDRVYFLCTERIATGSGFRPPAAPPPRPHESRVPRPPPPPPPGKIGISTTSSCFVHDNFFYKTHSPVQLTWLIILS